MRRSLRLLEKARGKPSSVADPAIAVSQVSTSETIEVPNKRRRIPKATPVPAVASSFSIDLPASLPRHFEDAAINKGLSHVVGVDEAGRGPLAGPVCAAAVYLPPGCEILGLVDSKLLTEEQREQVFAELTNPESGVVWAVATIDPVTIDRVNILQATYLAMTEAVKGVDEKLEGEIQGKSHSSSHPGFRKVQWALVDGNREPPGLKGMCETIVKGDGRCRSIAAASIIAKVTRDRLMVELDAIIPGYDLAQNKGYPTPFHKSAVQRLGPTVHHRVTFAPIKTMNLPEWAQKRLEEYFRVKEEQKAAKKLKK